MPKPFFQRSFNALTDQPNFKLKSGRYVDLRMVLEGTAKATETLDPSKIGQLQVTLNGTQIHNQSPNFYHRVNSEWNAPPEATLTTGGPVRFVWFVPFHLPELLSATRFAADKGQVRIQLNNGTSQHLDTVMDSATLRVTARGADLPQRYILHVAPDDRQFVGQFAGDSEEYDDPNIARLFFDDADDVISNIQISQDGRNLVTSQTLAELDDDDTHDNQNFQPTSLTEYNPVDTGGNLRSRQMTVQLDGDAGAGTSVVKTTRMYLKDLSV